MPFGQILEFNALREPDRQGPFGHVRDLRGRARRRAAATAELAPPGDRVAILAGKARLAGFKTPRDVCFLDELPKDVNGKIREGELHKQFAGS